MESPSRFIRCGRKYSLLFFKQYLDILKRDDYYNSGIEILKSGLD